MDATGESVQTAVSRCQLLTNFRFDRRGMLSAQVRLINVLPHNLNDPIDGVAYYYQATGTNVPDIPAPTDLMLVFSNGTLFFYIPSTNPFTTAFTGPFLATASNLNNSYFQGGVFVSKRVRTAALNDELIIVQDGGVQPQRFYSTAALGTHYWQAGLDTPSPAPVATAVALAGGITGGPYTYKMTYYDERSRESSPSDQSNAVTLSSAGNGAARLVVSINPWASGQGSLDHQKQGFYLYRNTTGGSVWYRVANVGMGRVAPYILLGNQYALQAGDWFLDPTAPDDKSSDAIIQTQAICPNPGENDIPNPASIICVHKNRVFLNDVTDNATLQISNLSSPTQWTSIQASPLIATDGLRMTVGTDQGDPINALIEFGAVLFISKRRSAYFLWGDDITDFRIIPIHERGCVAPDSAARCDNAVLYLSDDGVYAASYQSGEVVQKISKEIETILLAIDEETRETAVAWYIDHRYHLSVGMITFVYDFDAEGWATYMFGQDDLNLGIPGFPTIKIMPPSGNFPGSITLPSGAPPPNTGAGSPPGMGGGSGGSGGSGTTPGMGTTPPFGPGGGGGSQ